MTTIINNPGGTGSSDEVGVGFIIGMLLIIIALGFLFFVYGLPMLQREEVILPEGSTIQVTPPASVSTPTE